MNSSLASENILQNISSTCNIFLIYFFIKFLPSFGASQACQPGRLCRADWWHYLSCVSHRRVSCEAWRRANEAASVSMRKRLWNSPSEASCFKMALNLWVIIKAAVLEELADDSVLCLLQASVRRETMIMAKLCLTPYIQILHLKEDFITLKEANGVHPDAHMENFVKVTFLRYTDYQFKTHFQMYPHALG